MGYYQRPVIKKAMIHIVCRACGWEDHFPFGASERANESRSAHEAHCEWSQQPQVQWVLPPSLGAALQEHAAPAPEPSNRRKP